MVNAILLSLRPKTLAASLSPVAIGTLLAWQVTTLNWILLTITLLSATFIQIGTNLANDYYDLKKGTDTENRLGPKRATHQGIISLKTTKIAFISAFTAAFIGGIYLIIIGGWPILIIGLISIALGVLYTATPFALAYTGMADIVSCLFFGPIAVGGTYFLQTNTISLDILVYGLAPGLLSTAILVVNNLRDDVEDRQNNKKTLIVRFGRQFGRIEYVTCIYLAALLPSIIFIKNGTNCWAQLTLTLPIIAQNQIKSVFYDDSKDLNPTLGKTGRLLLIYTILISIGIVVS